MVVWLNVRMPSIVDLSQIDRSILCKFDYGIRFSIYGPKEAWKRMTVCKRLEQCASGRERQEISIVFIEG